VRNKAACAASPYCVVTNLDQIYLLRFNLSIVRVRRLLVVVNYIELCIWIITSFKSHTHYESLLSLVTN
jgi:hypothetical protein